MKVLIDNYTFNNSQGKITCTNFTNMSITNLLLVALVTSNTQHNILYNFATDNGNFSITNNIISSNSLIGLDINSKFLIYYDNTTISPSLDSTVQAVINALLNGNQLTKVENSNGEIINPAQDETIKLLRRLIKIVESISTVDSAQRQRITVDAMSTGLTLGNLTQIAGVDLRYLFMDNSRISYNGLRANLKNI